MIEKDNKSRNSIWVFGGANIDVIGHALNNLIEYDSNIGEIELSYGGVGRNIAQSCLLFSDKSTDINVNLITCF